MSLSCTLVSGLIIIVIIFFTGCAGRRDNAQATVNNQTSTIETTDPIVLEQSGQTHANPQASQIETLHGLPLSNMTIRITSQGHEATFKLYDTVAARELYEQLPLELELRNFRDAQWMFWPPERLNVTAQEAYHDGIRGELSYYQPWGNAFTLYKDFYARDQMHRLGINLTGIDELERMSGTTRIEKHEQH